MSRGAPPWGNNVIYQYKLFISLLLNFKPLKILYLSVKPCVIHFFTYVICISLFCAPLTAADFVVTSGTTVTTPQSLLNKEEGAIQTGGTLDTVTTAIDASGNDIKLLNSGHLQTTGNNARAISATGSNATIINDGTISTSGSNSWGIYGTQSDVNITGTGAINTSGTNGSGIYLTGTNANLAYDGSISTTGSGAHAVNSVGNNATVNLTGNISTIGGSTHGVNASGTSADIDIRGSVITTGNAGYALNSTNMDAILNNSGLLKTSGSFSRGIFSSGDRTTISNTGTIDTSGTGGYGVNITGDNTMISNSGTVQTVGNGAYGLFVTGNTATLTNSGSILTTNDNAFGIYAIGTGATINNTGSITTLALNAQGINTTAANVKIQNTGTISTSGTSAIGVNASGNNLSFVNDGSIVTKGMNAHALRTSGTNAEITNTGDLSTAGNNTYGLYSLGANARIINQGSVITRGNSAHGIRSSGANVDLISSGDVNVSGAGAIGIYSSGSDGQITLSGTVSATGGATQAILGSNNQTLNIMPGAKILGTIDLGGGTNKVNIDTSTGASSLTLRITNPGTVNHTGNGLAVHNNGVVQIIDPTGFTTSMESLNTTSLSIHQSLRNQLNKPQINTPIQVASLSQNDNYFKDDSYAWGQMFGSYSEGGGENETLDFHNTSYGIIGGYEKPIAGNKIGVFSGISQSETKTDISSIQTETTGGFVGGYGEVIFGSWFFNSALIAGYQYNRNERYLTDNINGKETAKSNFSNVYISPSMSLGKDFIFDRSLTLTPSADFTYTYGFYEDYQEKGSTLSNLKVGSRNIQTINSNLQLALSKTISDGVAVEFRTGASFRHYDDTSVNITANGTQLNYQQSGDNQAYGGYLGINGQYILEEQINLIADMEYGADNQNLQEIKGYIGLEYNF